MQGDGQRADEFREDIDQEMRIAGRTLFHLVKSTFESIASGVHRELVALFPYLVMEGGMTVAEHSDGHLLDLLRSDKLLLTAIASPNSHPAEPWRRN